MKAYNPKRQRAKGSYVRGWYLGDTLVEGYVLESQVLVGNERQHSIKLSKAVRMPYGAMKYEGDTLVLGELEVID